MAWIAHREQGLLYHTSTVQGVGVSHAFTTRVGGVSPAPYDSLNLRFSCDDDAENVRQNYERLFAVLGMDAARAVASHQLHHDNIRIVTEADAGSGIALDRTFTDTDALLTATENLPLVVYSADCGITLLHDPVHRAVGAVHSGWRGVALDILGKTVTAMQAAFGTDPQDLRVAVGAGIRACCFETDDDVSDALCETYGDAFLPYRTRVGNKWHIDLAGLCRHSLAKRGIPCAQIDILPDCTCCRRDLYWSHRRDGNARGVQAAVIQLNARRDAE